MYLGSISSLMHFSLNNIDMFCLHIFIHILSSCRSGFIESGGNWLMIANCYPSAFCSILGHHQGCVYYKSDVTFAFTLLLC